MNEFNLSRHQTKNILSKYADLKIQAMMFDMDIDIETRSLEPKSKYKEPFWIARWKEKMNNSDDGAEAPSQNLGEDDYGRR